MEVVGVLAEAAGMRGMAPLSEVSLSYTNWFDLYDFGH